MIITKECKRCGKKFETDRNAKKFCSKQCRIVYTYYGKKQTEWECASCGKMFYSERKRKYCKPDCSRQNYIKPKPDRTQTKPKHTLAELNALARSEGLSYGQYLSKYGYR